MKQTGQFEAVVNAALQSAQNQRLERPNAWSLGGGGLVRFPATFVAGAVRLLPRKLREAVAGEMERTMTRRTTARLVRAAESFRGVA